MGIFGGGGGGVDVSSGVNAVQQGTQQGLSALQQYYQQAVPALQQGAQQAQNYYVPYGMAGSNSLDALQDLMGIARPEQGSFALTQALQNQQALKDKMTGVSSQAGWIDPGTFNTSWSGNRADSIGAAGHGMMATGTPGGQGSIGFDPTTGKLISTTKGAWDTANNGILDPNAYGLNILQDSANPGRYKLESKVRAGGVLTPEEQAQWDMIDKYNKGTLGMTNGTARSNSALEQLMQSPGYQFTLGQGLQGVDRSAAARGLTGSGAAIKGATNYASGLAQKTYNDRVSQLAAGAGMGQQTANNQAQTAGSLGGALATLASNMGSNTASLYGAQSGGLASIYGGKAAADANQTSSLYGLAGSLLGSIF